MERDKKSRRVRNKKVMCFNRVNIYLSIKFMDAMCWRKECSCCCRCFWSHWKRHCVVFTLSLSLLLWLALHFFHFHRYVIKQLIYGVRFFGVSTWWNETPTISSIFSTNYISGSVSCDPKKLTCSVSLYIRFALLNRIVNRQYSKPCKWLYSKWLGVQFDDVAIIAIKSLPLTHPKSFRIGMNATNRKSGGE